jgi:hypothetical protein
MVRHLTFKLSLLEMLKKLSYLILWHDGWKPEYPNKNRSPLLGNGSLTHGLLGMYLTQGIGYYGDNTRLHNNDEIRNSSLLDNGSRDNEWTQ